LLGHHPEQPTPAPSANGWLTLSSPDAATLAHGLRITPAFLESRRRLQPGGGFFMPSRAGSFLICVFLIALVYEPHKAMALSFNFTLISVAAFV
jgi:hypothetical protein